MVAAATAIPDPTPDPTEKPPRPRRWVPLSLRLLFVILPAAAIVGLTALSMRAYRNASAIREIERLGGEVNTRSRAPEWLQTRIHDERMELLDDVTRVSLDAPVTDAWLAQLEVLSSLEDLWLFRTKVTDAGLVHLKGLSHLQTLGLPSTRVSDAGLVHLSGLNTLQHLNLAQTDVSDAGLAHLTGLTDLQSIGLDETQVTDAGLVHLAELPNLQSLSLEKTRVGDAGLAHLSRLTGLQKLTLDDTQVTDAGLVHLKRLTNLQELRLCRTAVTEAGIADLERALPQASIYGLFPPFWISSPYPFWRSHSPLFFASAGFLIIVAVVVCLLSLVFLFPIAAVIRGCVWGWRRALGTNTQADIAAAAGLASFLDRPHLVWLGRLTVALIIVAAALRIAMPIYRQQATVEEIQRLGGWFHNLFRFPEDATPPIGVGLRQLDRLTSLQGLSLSRSQITDSDLVLLERLTTLQALELGDTAVTDAGLTHLEGLLDLRELDLENTQVTDAGLVTLTRLSGLQELDLSNTRVTDAGVAHLATFTDLRKLRLADMPQVTGEGISNLWGLTKLESLSLEGMELGKLGLGCLKELKNLKTLSLKNTVVSAADIADLQRALPGLEVEGSAVLRDDLDARQALPQSPARPPAHAGSGHVDRFELGERLENP